MNLIHSGGFMSLNIQNLSPDDEETVSILLRRNLEMFDERKCILVATFKRLRNLNENYSREGCHFLVAKSGDRSDAQPIACVGIGPLHGLPSSEGVGEIRDLVVDENYRGQGIGRILLDRILESAKFLGYRRLYLETTRGMQAAQKLFVSRGFRPITDRTALLVLGEVEKEKQAEELPCYFLLENL